MAWPADDLNTNDFDDGASDSPALARVMLKRLIERTKTLIAARGIANGIASLGADGRVPQAQLPVSTGGGGGQPLYRPTGQYFQLATGSNLVQLTTSVHPWRRLRIELDYQYAGGLAPGLSRPLAGMPAKPYYISSQDVWVYRVQVPASGFWTVNWGPNKLSLGLQVTTSTTMTLLVTPSDDAGVVATANPAGVRLYGIHGYAV